MNKKQKNTVWKTPKRIFKFIVFIMLILTLQLSYLSLSPNLYGINMDKFAQTRNTYSSTLTANRGTIYDRDNNVLALNVTSYTVIAYLSEKRTGNNKKPLHVVDKENTAKTLSPLLNMDEAELIKLLSKDSYQVELGPGGRNITELKKIEIQKLNLPGIDFVESTKRYYPNGDFASYTVGYAKDIKGVITGEMGIESKFNKQLKGKNGYLEYQKDRFGYKIPDTKEYRIDEIDGSDIYLTLDATMQRFVESAVKEATKQSTPQWMNLTVMDAKTGDILATTGAPSFDPNIKNIVNYQNPLVTSTYEPGSTMKIYSYMCAIEKGTYDGNKIYDSTSITFTDDTIRDWNKIGFGNITFDKGFEYSSNVGASQLTTNFITGTELKDCLKKYGFSKPTKIELSNELSGKINFKYPVEIASASFGQGITTTAIQQLQALTIISNNGKMLTPHIVDKIVDSKTNEIIYESKKTETQKLVSENTITKIKNLMESVVAGTDPFTTGKIYYQEGYDIIGKTGTAQYVNPKTGKYVDGSYIYSFSGMFPKENPEIIIYASLAKPTSGANYHMQMAVNDVIKNVATYLNIFEEKNIITDNNLVKLDSYINKETKIIQNELNNKGIKTIIIGSGNKIIDQYPKQKEQITSSETVILKTNDKNIYMEDLTNLSSKTTIKYLEMINIPYKIEGTGYTVYQNIQKNTLLKKEDEILVVFNNKY